MTERKSEDIMADYLLKGGKMLAKECKVCGSPLFELKGETVCVVCAERRGQERRAPAAPPAPAPAIPVAGEGSAGAAIESAITALCARVETEGDERRCLTLMEAVLAGSEALRLLRQP
ncbi:Sjogren's syndrome/scleroderma autoantigen 1 family protein [Methanofollis fontis]|uniref:Sjogrens syndrome scleroderma autoantigen 1 n=1 Tax=Methanofollis fontis TaxID=2052832 RepID=A0A483CT21_9EURY|nr:autoantigen p27 domain-containing protein [Methanofollis fontis]TAJ44473.1 hypothetical protein CUJ86_03905 [Methanofollis fontis]